jgi:hypothetical protein
MNRVFYMILLAVVLMFLSNPGNAVPDDQLQQGRGFYPQMEKVQDDPAVRSLNDLKEAVYRFFSRFSDKPLEKRSLLYQLIPAFLFLMAVFVLSIMIIAIVIYVIKKHRYNRIRKISRIWHHYRDILVDYLNNHDSDPVPEFPGLKNRSHKNVLIQQLYELANVIYGKKQVKLNNIYQDGHLHSYLFRKIRNGDWHIRALYMKYLSVRPFRGKFDGGMHRYTRSRNDHIRLYSQLAYMSHHPDDAFSFLEGYEYPLSEWDQMNLYETMLHNSIPIPDLYQYLDSSNHSVVIFILRLIRWYYVSPGDPEMLLRYIDHPHHQVRLEAYKSIVELNIQGVGDVFRYHYMKEAVEVKRVMIDYFVRNKKLNKTWYNELLEIEHDKRMLFYLLESLYNQSFKSQQEVMDIWEETEDPSIRAMCQHIIANAS